MPATGLRRLQWGGGALCTFNSLFEMLHRRGGDHRMRNRGAFNSLFEMPASRAQTPPP